jgi:ACS family hexuronate transporter-like MFS transporter
MAQDDFDVLQPAEGVKGEADVSPMEDEAASATGAAFDVAAHPPSSGRRWTVCALLFFATTVNYLDRSVLNVLAPTLRDTFHWTDLEYSYSATAFAIAYAIGMLVAGAWLDRVGTRKGFAVAATIWSLAAMASGISHYAVGWWPTALTFGVGASAVLFSLSRFVLGIAESANFPAAVKTVAEWFPKKERALATGIFNAGSNVGAILAPIIGVWVAVHWGWEWAFVVTGAFGLVFVVVWLAVYRIPHEDARLSKPEYDYIMSDQAEPATKIPWARLLPYPQAWAFAIGKLITDPVWWFWLFWLGIFLSDKFDVKLTGLVAPLVVIYVAADVGSIAGGWLSSALIKRGWSVNAARKTTMLICALCVVPVIAAIRVEHMWTAVGLIALAAAAHQAWSANLFTLVSDTSPRRAVGSVVGLGGFLGGVGGVLINLFVGPYLKAHPGVYLPVFVFAGFGYLIALGIIQILTPRLEPAGIDV